MRVISGNLRGTILQTIDDIKTRPTLDRVKESLFNIIQEKIEDAIVLDLFAGSGAIGIECLSRRAKKAYFCDNSLKSVNVIEKNIEKTRLKDKSVIVKGDYNNCLKELNNIKFDIIFLDPPYKEDFGTEAIKIIDKEKLLNQDGIIIIETDEPERDINKIKKMDIKYKIYDLRKYGRASLIFLK